MTTQVGTSYFRSKAGAVAYYRDYEGSNAKAAVERKLREGQIHIGPPPLKPGQRAYLIDGGLRYAVENPARKANPGNCGTKSVTLRNMSSVTITRKPNGQVEVKGRKAQTARRAAPKRKNPGDYIIRGKEGALRIYAKLKALGYKVRMQKADDGDYAGQRGYWLVYTEGKRGKRR